MSRRSLTNAPEPAEGLPPRRRQGGARRETSERVRFMIGSREVEGWALNRSRGGIRAIVDEPIDLGVELELSMADGPMRAARIVWIQEEPDGAIVGVEFLDVEGSIPPEPPDAISARNPQGKPGQGTGG